MSFDKLMFTGQRFCLKDLKIRRAELTSVPLAPIKDLVKLQYLFLDKNNITRLHRDELKGITATSISFSDNPIRTVEKGAFNGLRPKVILLLERTEVSDLSFIFDYPEDTFRFLSLYESPIPCDCTLKKILQMRSENFLYGTCSHRGQGVNLRDPKLAEIMSMKCLSAPETVIANQTTKMGGGAALPHTVEPQIQRRQKQVGNREGQGNIRKKNRRKSKSSRDSSSTSSSSKKSTNSGVGSVQRWWSVNSVCCFSSVLFLALVVT